MEESGASDLTAFSYKFKDDLRITNNPRIPEEAEEEPDLDRNVDDQDIDVGISPSKARTVGSS